MSFWGATIITSMVIAILCGRSTYRRMVITVSQLQVVDPKKAESEVFNVTKFFNAYRGEENLVLIKNRV